MNAANAPAIPAPQTLAEYLDNVLAVTPTVRDAILAQGLQSFDQLDFVTDDGMKDLCANVRKPGGRSGNQANHGAQVGYFTELQLRQLRYWKFHMRRIQRAFDPVTATTAALAELWKRFKEEEKDNDVEAPPAMKRVEEIRTTLEGVDAFLNDKRGEYGSPFFYVVRESVEIPVHDPGYGQPTLIEELIRRTPHVGHEYNQDNRAVWKMLRKVMHGGPGWTWIDEFSRQQDGRAAYLAIKRRFLGQDERIAIKEKAVSTIHSLHYNGLARNFTFDDYCNRMQQAFTDLRIHGEPQTEEQKVRQFLRGIKDQRLEVYIATIKSNDNYRLSFDNALAFLVQFARNNEITAQRTRSISQSTSMQRSQGGSHVRGSSLNPNPKYTNKQVRFDTSTTRGDVSFNPSNPNRNYTNWEWRSLTEEQRNLVKNARKQDRKAPKRKVSQLTTSDEDDGKQGAGVGSKMNRRTAPTDAKD
jgi:hypothetical protein